MTWSFSEENQRQILIIKFGSKLTCGRKRHPQLYSLSMVHVSLHNLYKFNMQNAYLENLAFIGVCYLLVFNADNLLIREQSSVFFRQEPAGLGRL